MIIVLTTIVTGSMMGAIVAWSQSASALTIGLSYVGGGWLGLLLALAVLMLRPDAEEDAPAPAPTSARTAPAKA
ncbi:hypothetical protein [Paracoccus sanguinis]|mgnify:FL=1|uniref:Uncharacterized protein n=1 Tax=Paracoccus sanguinis TaxID=1545044 RepID=A0A099GHI2_9RHOB|nr:hypothetical protein [Paracoccus sanguinis]KGJ13552.1 hypothetical protein IX54_11365 [Paracoccus sanguinis]KGJ22161.1 hypothetical protein IX56_09785 [Paracoccus sanguinis]